MSPKEQKARALARTLREAGFVAYFAGGCVRDRLLGVEPGDYDIATDAHVDDVRRLFAKTVPVGAKFGVILVVADGDPFEVATFRADAPYIDGRRPSAVRFTSAEEDAQRRDFTINGMFLDPENDSVIDHVGGQRDLQAGVIRAIGDAQERLREDRLRMLRGVRFAARFGFEMESETHQAICRASHLITEMAWERIGDEVVKTLIDGPPGSARRAFELLDSTGLLAAILPEIRAMQGVEQSPDYHPEGDVFVHTLGLLERLDHPSETLALGALLHDVAKPTCAVRRDHRITFYGHCEVGAEMAEDVCKRLKRSRHTRERVGFLVRHHLRHLQAPQMRAATLKRFLATDGIDELLELARLDALASNGDLRSYEFCRDRLAELGSALIAPPPLLTGRDLITAGLSPGPAFGDLLRDVRDAQLEGEVSTRSEALDWLRRRGSIPQT